MKASGVVFKAVFAVSSRDVSLIISDQKQSMVAPPIRHFRRGTTSVTQTAPKLERSWREEDTAIEENLLV